MQTPEEPQIPLPPAPPAAPTPAPAAPSAAPLPMPELATVPNYELLFQGTGVVQPGAIYIRRSVDTELPAALSQGQFCHVMAPRQSGKSSLRTRTQELLRARGAVCVTLDLSAVGTAANAEGWYYGLCAVLADQLGQASPEVWYHNDPHVPPVVRWQRYLKEFVLRPQSGHVVLFIDEIDVAMGLPFSRSDFFAALRALHDGRGEDPLLQRLTCCLLGATPPLELMDDPTRTPFAVSRTFTMPDFTLEEAHPFLTGLPRAPLGPQAWLDAIFHWTAGHPALTQRLCEALAQGIMPSDGPGRLPWRTGRGMRSGPSDASGRPDLSDVEVRTYVEALVRTLFVERGLNEVPALMAIDRAFAKRNPRAAGMLSLYRRLLDPTGEQVTGRTGLFPASLLQGPAAASAMTPMRKAPKEAGEPDEPTRPGLSEFGEPTRPAIVPPEGVHVVQKPPAVGSGGWRGGLRGQRIAVERNHDSQLFLKATGLVVEAFDEEGALLEIRNRVFALVFDEGWARRKAAERYLSVPLHRWLDNDRDPGYLLLGEELAAGVAWARGRVDVDPEEREFLLASGEAARLTEKAALEAQGVERALQQEAERELERRKQRRIFEVLVGCIGGLFAIMIWLAVDASRSRSARGQADRARLATEQSLAQRDGELRGEQGAHKATQQRLADTQRSLELARAEIVETRGTLGAKEQRQRDVEGDVVSISMRAPGRRSGSGDDAMIKRVMLQQGWPAARRCLGGTPALTAALRLDVHLQEGGGVERIKVTGPQASPCVQEALRKAARFPGSGGIQSFVFSYLWR